MAWIVPIATSPRRPKPRWQVRYQEGKRERSARIFQTPEAARNRGVSSSEQRLEHCGLWLAHRETTRGAR